MSEKISHENSCRILMSRVPLSLNIYGQHQAVIESCSRNTHRRVRQDLRDFLEMKTNERTLFRQFSTNDNYYNDIRPTKERDVEILQQIVELFEKLSN